MRVEAQYVDSSNDQAAYFLGINIDYLEFVALINNLP
jgi:hypothetical protein